MLPIDGPPIRDGWVAIDGGRIVATGSAADCPSVDRDLGAVALLPGLVNAHAHLELSYLRGHVAPERQFVDWIRAVVRARRQTTDPHAPDVLRGVQAGIDESIACGTALIGDISNTLVTVEPLTHSPLAAVVFYELIRFAAADASELVERALGRLQALDTTDTVRTSLAAHAPYSVAPAAMQAIRRAAEQESGAPWSVHLAESADEVEFVLTGEGAWRRFLHEMGAWDPEWVVPGVSPVAYLDALAVLGGGSIVVHGVHMTAPDLGRLRDRGATLVTCPRSNVRTGAGVPPVEAFYQSGVRVAVGTDSLASTPDLSVFAELAALRRLAPSVTASRLLDSATRQGAIALGFEGEFGTLAPGARARVLSVPVPASIHDVEEYLVSGIQPDRLRWLEAD